MIFRIAELYSSSYVLPSSGKQLTDASLSAICWRSRP
jgi:hypothetical protein